MDWTVKLWYTSQHAKVIQAAKPVDGTEPGHTPGLQQQQQQTPLVVLESTSAALFDAQWCPTHVSVFAVGDGVGNVDLWNLLTDSDVSPCVCVRAVCCHEHLALCERFTEPHLQAAGV
jgi:hypothetical protein